MSLPRAQGLAQWRGPLFRRRFTGNRIAREPLMIFALAAVTALTALAPTQDLGSWPQHSMHPPQPPVVTPAPSDKPSAPPPAAVVLFDGSTLAGGEAHSAK